MPDTHRLAITAQAPGERSTVTLDDHDISAALRRVDLTVEVGHVPTATLHVMLLDATPADATEARILIPQATRDTLLALGWTPPAEPEPTDDLHLTPYLVVHRYRDERRVWAWSWICDGDGTCKGHHSLGFDNRKHAEANAREHLAVEHTATAAKEG